MKSTTRIPLTPAPPPTTTVITQAPSDRVVTYPEGRWTLYGDGTTASPNYWVWVPAGAAPPPPPPLPLPRW